MISLLFEPAFMPFTGSLCIMLLVAFLEGTGLLFGASLTSLFDSILPDIDFDLDASSPNALSNILGWMNIGKVPLLVILIILLVIFGLFGYALQYTTYIFFGHYIPTLLAVPVVLITSIPATKWITNSIRKILPSDESSALYMEDFIGGVAVITIGTAKKGVPAEARYLDRFGQNHHFMVEPENDQEFHQGDFVMLSKKAKFGFYVLEVTNEYLK